MSRGRDGQSWCHHAQCYLVTRNSNEWCSCSMFDTRPSCVLSRLWATVLLETLVSWDCVSSFGSGKYPSTCEELPLPILDITTPIDEAIGLTRSGLGSPKYWFLNCLWKGNKRRFSTSLNGVLLRSWSWDIDQGQAFEQDLISYYIKSWLR